MNIWFNLELLFRHVCTSVNNRQQDQARTFNNSWSLRYNTIGKKPTTKGSWIESPVLWWCREIWKVFFFKLKCQYFFYSQYNQLNKIFVCYWTIYSKDWEKKATALILLNTFYFNLLRDLDIHPRNDSSKTSQNSSTTKTFKKYNQRVKLNFIVQFQYFVVDPKGINYRD